MKLLNIRIWQNIDHRVRHGYSRATEDELATFRIGPLVVGWELLDD